MTEWETYFLSERANAVHARYLAVIAGFSCDVIIFPKLKITNPTENLVSSNVRLSNNLAFYNV